MNENVRTSSEALVLSVREVSQMLHTNPALVYRFVDLGLLPALKLGSIRVRRDALEEFLRTYEGCDLSNPEDIKPLSQAG